MAKNKNAAKVVALAPSTGAGALMKPRRKARRRASNPATGHLLTSGIAAGVGGLLTECGYNIIAWLAGKANGSAGALFDNRLVKVGGKIGLGIALALIAEKIKFLKINTYAGAVGAGGIAVGFAEGVKMFTGGRRGADFLMPVKIHKSQKAAAVAQGAVPAEVVAQKAVEGSKPAMNAMAAISDWEDDDELQEGIADVVFVPVKSAVGGGLSDVVLMPQAAW